MSAEAPSSLHAAADATTVMASEADMPVLRVLSVDEVPTLKADPVDPIARGQAKVRSRSFVARGRAAGGIHYSRSSVHVLEFLSA